MLLAGLDSPSTAEVPMCVEELWADFDPRADPLEIELIREWRSDGMVFRHVRFLVGKFKGQPARMAAIYGFPEGAKEKLPAVMHIHGGGQRASLNEVRLLAVRGYAVLSVNWGGSGNGRPPFNAVEGARPDDPNTDWGAVDPTQLNVAGYGSILPGPKQFYVDREHPKNNNWYLLTLGCRRGLTFLERQPEVDPQRLGVHGYSMGGNLTMYVAGTDRRVKAAVPGVGGQGWRWQPHLFLGGVAQQEHIRGDVEVFRRTLSFESYAPLIRCPLLHRSATNDFHGWMDDVYRTDALIDGPTTRHTWAVHLNHQLTPEVAVAMPLWFDHFLKGGPALPETPASQLLLNTEDGIPRLNVTTTSGWPVARCEIYYSVDPDPRSRFWRSTDGARTSDTFGARLPLHTTDLPLFAFANVFYTLPKAESTRWLQSVQARGEVRQVCLSTLLHTATAAELRSAGVCASDRASRLIDDFSHGRRDWLDRNPDHWQNWTRKVADPQWRGPHGARLAVALKMAQTNHVTVVVIENEWRNYRGPKRTFVCEKEIPGAPGPQSVLLKVSDFKNTTDATPLGSWTQLDQLGCVARYVERGQTPSKPRPWRGPAPEFFRLEWK